MPRQKSSCRRSSTPKVRGGSGAELIVRVAAGEARWVWRGVVRGKRIEVGMASTRLQSLKEAREAAFEHTRTARLGGVPGARGPLRHAEQ